VVGDQAALHGFGVLDVAEIEGAVQAGSGKFGEVAGVVQLRDGLDQLGVVAEGRLEGAGLGSDSLDVRPSAGKSAGEEGAGEAFGRGCEGLHTGHASQPGRDVHGRGLASGDV
jgi:hypothetical protein